MRPETASAGFSMLEVMLAVAILALLASLSLPRMLIPAQRALVLRAQTELAELGFRIGVAVTLAEEDWDTLVASLPDSLHDEQGEPVYRLDYLRAPDRDRWWILASPIHASAAEGLPAMLQDAGGRCWLDRDSDGAPGPQDSPCSGR